MGERVYRHSEEGDHESQKKNRADAAHGKVRLESLGNCPPFFQAYEASDGCVAGGIRLDGAVSYVPAATDPTTRPG